MLSMLSERLQETINKDETYIFKDFEPKARYLAEKRRLVGPR
jgi:hypothetical protein